MIRLILNSVQKSALLNYEKKAEFINLFGDAVIDASWHNKIICNRSSDSEYIILTFPSYNSQTENFPIGFKFRGINGGFKFSTGRFFYQNNNTKTVQYGNNFELITDRYYPNDVHLFTELNEPNKPVILQSGLVTLLEEWNGKQLVATLGLTDVIIPDSLPSNFKCTFLVGLNSEIKWVLIRSINGFSNLTQTWMFGSPAISTARSSGTFFTISDNANQQIFLTQTVTAVQLLTR